MVQILPGLGEQLAPALGIITESALNVMKPNRKLQEAMQAALATNPGLLQQFASIEKSAPGTAAALGLGPELASIIAATPETMSAEIERATRGQKVATAKKAADVESKQLDIQSTVTDSTVRLLATNMGIGPDAARRMLGLPTTQQEKAGEQALEAGKLEIDLGKERLKEVARIEELRKKVPALQERGSMREIAREFMKGQLSPLETTALFSTPEMAQGFTTMLSVLRNEEEDALRKELAATQMERTSSNRDELKASFKVTQAGMMLRQTEVGTLDAWEAYLFDPEVTKIVQDIAKNPNKEVTPENLIYKEIADHIRKTQDENQRKNTFELVRIVSSITTQEKGFSLEPTQERINRIASINLLLEERARLGGPVITAHMPSRTLARDNVIEYRDKDGKKLSNREAAALVHNPMARENKGTSLSPNDQMYFNRIANEVGNPQATFDKLKLEEPDVAKRIESALRTQGVIK